MSFKKWLLLQESNIKQNSDKSKRIQVGQRDRKPEWAARWEILSMKKK